MSGAPFHSGAGMRTLRTFQDLFKRYRRPGDLVFAAGFFALSLLLAAAIPWQVTWVGGLGVIEQPAFWPVVAIAAMVTFSSLHLVGALVSERIPGRRKEVFHWLRSVEFALWFMAYVFLVPWIGYLLGSVLFVTALSFRQGYRSARWMGTAALFAATVVVLFKGLLQVRVPAGEIYQYLPPGDLRTFVMTWL